MAGIPPQGEAPAIDASIGGGASMVNASHIFYKNKFKRKKEASMPSPQVEAPAKDASTDGGAFMVNASP